jgi:hypothetical protein
MIPEQPGTSASMRLGLLLQDIKPERISWLRKIIIRNDFEFVEAYRNLTTMAGYDYINTDFANPFVRDSIPDLDAICQAYPGVSVRYVSPAFHSVSGGYLLEDVLVLGAFVTEGLHRVDLRSLVPQRFHGILNVLKRRIMHGGWPLRSIDLVVWAFEDDNIEDVDAFISALLKDFTLSEIFSEGWT